MGTPHLILNSSIQWLVIKNTNNRTHTEPEAKAGEGEAACVRMSYFATRHKKIKHLPCFPT